MIKLDMNTSNNSFTHNAQTPTIMQTTHSNPNQADGTITVHHQNGPVTLPIEEPLPTGYVKMIYIYIYI